MLLDDNPIALIEENLERCLLCGRCRSVCPIFREVGLEMVSPRGRVALTSALARGEISLSEVFKKQVVNCLRCMACVDICPSDVEPNETTTAVYRIIASSKVIDPIRGIMFRILLRRGRLLPPFTSFWANLFRILSPLLPEWTRLRHLLPLPTMKGIRYMPGFANMPFSYYIGYYNRVYRAGRWKHRVALFFGCASNLVFPETAHSMIAVYIKHGIGVYIPPTQGCCGFPAGAYGDEKTRRKRLYEFERAFSGLDVDAVVTICATCGHNLREARENMLIAVPEVYDALVYLSEVADCRFKGANSKVAYHIPCHLGRGQGATEIVKRFLERALGEQFAGMILEGECCGGGGVYNLIHPDIAFSIGEKKVGAFVESGADVLTTSCPSCKIFLTEVMAKRGLPEVKNVWEVLYDLI